MRKTIFVSSVQKELADERAVLYESISTDPLLSRFFEPFLFEYLPARDRRAGNIYRNEIASASVFVAIVGREYGSLSESGISISHQEYRWAKEREIPCLIFIRGSDMESRESLQQEFIREIRQDGYTYRRFANVIELKAQLYASLVQILEEGGLLEQFRKEKPKRKEDSAEKKRVFLVHGRDEAARHKVARYIERLVGDIDILSEMPSEGQTIIEKLERYASNVGFALILLTADDKGGLANLGANEYLPRARQNVILELGFFIGLLGRKNVCALYTSGVEIPSDYHGVVYIELDENDAWKLPLARELKSGGVECDMNRAI